MQEIKLMPTLLSCQISISTLETKPSGLASVGHFGFFQVQFQRQPTWPLIIAAQWNRVTNVLLRAMHLKFLGADKYFAPEFFRGRQMLCSPSDLCDSHFPFYRRAFSGTENIFHAKVIYDVEQSSRFWENTRCKNTLWKITICKHNTLKSNKWVDGQTGSFSES